MKVVENTVDDVRKILLNKVYDCIINFRKLNS